MKTMGLRIGYLGLLAMTISACSSAPANDSEGASTEPKPVVMSPEQPSNPEPSKAAGNPTAENPVGGLPADVADPVSGDRGNDGNVVSGEAKVIAELTIGADHTVTFTEIESNSGGGEGAADILVSETHGKTSPSALTSIADLRGSKVTAHDVFFALSEVGVVVPPRIAKLNQSLVGRKQSWGLGELKKIATVQPMLAASNACANASFVSATYGGILPNNSSWLDVHPSNKYSHFLYKYYGPNGLTSVSTERYDFTLARYGISQYRGKVCLESVEGAGLPTHSYYHEGANVWQELKPRASIQYRRPGKTTWSVATTIYVSGDNTMSTEWAWFGDSNEQWDWRMTVSAALPQDFVDYMRSYLD